MNISIYVKYKVKIKRNYSMLCDFSDDCYEEEKTETEIVLAGAELIKKIKQELEDIDLNEIETDKDTIKFSFFNPTTGEDGETIYKIEQIKGEQ